MQDKDFDKLFQSKLDGLDMEPSAQVWVNIDAELNGRKKRSILPLLSIAASIIVLITVAILFIPKKVKVDTEKPGKNNLVNNQPAVKTVKPEVKEPVNAPVVKDIKPESSAPVNSIAVVHHTKKSVAPVENIEKPVELIAKQTPVKQNEQPVLIAEVSAPKTIEITASSVPGPEIPLSVKQPNIDVTPEFKAAPVLASAQTPSVKQTARPAKRHGIRNFGDLVNLVVAKVDKRKDKVIEFTDSDEESTITGVHVGAINIKKDNK